MPTPHKTPLFAIANPRAPPPSIFIVTLSLSSPPGRLAWKIDKVVADSRTRRTYYLFFLHWDHSPFATPTKRLLTVPVSWLLVVLTVTVRLDLLVVCFFTRVGSRWPSWRASGGTIPSTRVSYLESNQILRNVVMESGEVVDEMVFLFAVVVALIVMGLLSNKWRKSCLLNTSSRCRQEHSSFRFLLSNCICVMQFDYYFFYCSNGCSLLLSHDPILVWIRSTMTFYCLKWYRRGS